MAGTTVRDGPANLAMAYAVADITRTISLEAQRSSIATTPGLRPAQTDMGQTGSDSTKSPPAAGGLPHHRPSLQSPVASMQTDDGEQDLCRGHLSKTSLSNPHGASETEASRAETDAEESDLGLRSVGQDGYRRTGASRTGDSRSCQPRLSALANALGQVVAHSVSGINQSGEAVWSTTVRADGQRSGLGLAPVPSRALVPRHPAATD